MQLSTYEMPHSPFVRSCTTPRQRLICIKPLLLLLTLERRCIHALDLPEPTFRLVDMILPVVPAVCDVRFQHRIDLRSRSCVRLVLVGKRDRDVVDLKPDEGCSGVGSSAYPHGVAAEGDEVDDDVERWQPDRSVVFGDVLAERFPRRLVLEGPSGVID